MSMKLHSRWRVWRTVFVLAWQNGPIAAVLAVSGWFLTTVLAGPVLALTLGALSESANQAQAWAIALLALALIVPEVILQGTDAIRHYLRERCQLTVDDEIIKGHLGIQTLHDDMETTYQDCVYFLRSNARALADSFLIVAGALGLIAGFIVSTVTLITMHPTLALPAALAAVLGALQLRVSAWAHRIHEKLTTSRRRLTDLVDAVTSPEHSTMVATTEVAAWSEGICRKSLEAHRTVLWRTNLAASAVNVGMFSLQVIAMIVMIVLAFILGDRGLISPSQVIAAITLNQFVLESARGLVSNMNQLNKAHVLGGRLQTVLDQATKTSASAEEEGSGRRGVDPGPLKLHDLTYTYPGCGSPSLKDLTLCLDPGTTYAIVGNNGAGKSTLAKILAGLLPVTDSYTVGDQPLESIGYVRWRTHVAYTFQQSARLPVSLVDNIRVGDLTQVSTRHSDEGQDSRGQASQGQASEDLAKHHLRAVGGADLLKADQRADLTVGQEVSTPKLSAGQWQRVAAARTAYRSKPWVRIVDEPTSALDPQHEYDAFRRLYHEVKKPEYAETIQVFITHRYSSARAADCIVLLEQGRIKAVGSHDELMDQSAEYRKNIERYDALLAADQLTEPGSST